MVEQVAGHIADAAHCSKKTEVELGITVWEICKISPPIDTALCHYIQNLLETALQTIFEG